LVDGEPVFPILDSKRFGACGREVDLGTKHADTPAIVLPSPAPDAAAAAVLQIDHGAARGADAECGIAGPIDRVRELDVNRVVTPVVAEGPPPYPQPVGPSRLGHEAEFGVSQGSGEGGVDLGGAAVQALKDAAVSRGLIGCDREAVADDDGA
jgi:hypothetical protein